MIKKILLPLFALLTGLVFLTGCSGDEALINQAFKLYKETNTFIEKCETTGEDKQIINKWMSLEGEKDVAYETLTGENGNINVATTALFEPFSYVSNNKYAGICIDYVYRFAKEYGYTITIHDYSTIYGAIDAVQNGKDDMIAAPTTITEERKSSVAFSKSYYLNQIYNVTLFKNKDIYNTPESLANKKIGIITGTNLRDYALRDVPTATILEYPTPADLNLAIKKGDIQSYYMDSSVYDFMVLSEKEVIKTYVTDTNYYGFAFARFGYQTVSELKNSKISILQGSIHESYVKEKLPNATLDYYSDISSCMGAVSSNKAQAFVSDYAIAREKCKSASNFYVLQESIGQCDVGAAFPKTTEGEAKRDEFNSFLADYTSSGDLEELITKWSNYVDGQTPSYIPYDSLPGEKGTLTLAVDSSIIPFTFAKDNRYTGLEIELFYYFCKQNGYALEIKQMNFEKLIDALSYCDAAASMILISEERKEKVNFSTSYYTSDVILVCETSSASQKSIFESIRDSFYKTFIKEERWKMFLVGIGNTLLITVFAILGGILLGGLLFMLCKDGNKIANKFAKIYTSLLHNIPIIVILMIFYYVVFGKVSIEGTVVSIIVFSLTFSTSIFGMLKTSVNTIGKEQFEAAYALGYRKNQAFFKIILPQASKFFYPHLSSDIVSLLKETAIVGYIAVMDLTKVSDIIRSRTYDAFFPLLASAVIYFILAVLLVKIVEFIQKKMDPRRKNKKVIKGVNMHD